MKLYIPNVLVEWIIARAQRTPYFHLPGYMNRWWLVPYLRAGSEGAEGTGPVSFWRRPVAWVLQRLGIAVRVHEILRSDNDRALHNHPWGYVTIILKGGYVEITDDGMRWYGPGSVLIRGTKHKHRLVLDPAYYPATKGEQQATTLFITGPYKQKWGFFTPAGKVPYDVYFATKQANKDI